MNEWTLLRVGYHPDNLPFSFFNGEGELVGYDIDAAHLLAEQLGCRLEFVPFEFSTLREQLDRGDYDGLRIAVPREADIARLGAIVAPGVEFVPIPTVRDYFESGGSKADAELAGVLSQWIEFVQAGAHDDRLYDHWILGKGAESSGPRWSVIRDVLHWVGD